MSQAIYKDFLSTVKDIDGKGRIIVAANAIGNVDSQKDRSMDGSFDKTLSENFSRLKWFLNHDPSILIGVPITGKQDSAYLKMEGQLNMNKQIGREVYEDYKLYAEHNKSLEHSIGVTAVKFQQKGDIREVYEWKLWEYSTLTAWGANDNTPMLGMKSFEDVQATIDWLELKLKKGKYSDETFLQIEQQLTKLRTLCKEPPEGTLVVEPGVSVVDVIKQYLSQSN